MKKKLGTITVGQSPRNDVIPEMMEFLGDVDILQAGALDGLSYNEILNLDVKDDDYILVSILRDGRSVKFAERHILHRLQGCIEKLENDGADAILFICTGVFPDVFKSTKPLLYPQKIIHCVIPHLIGNGKLAVVVPHEDQVNQSINKWQEVGMDVDVVSGSPYSKTDEISDVIAKLNKSDAQVVMMDCIGYTSEMKKRVVEGTGKSLILARTFVSRVLGELLNS